MSEHSSERKFTLDLNKSTSAFRLSLDKAGVPKDIKAELVVVMDVSGSFEHEHEEGTTGILLERFIPLAKVLDPDGKIDLITFSNGQNSVQHLGTLDESNAGHFIVDESHPRLAEQRSCMLTKRLCARLEHAIAAARTAA